MSDYVTITGKEGTALHRQPREAKVFMWHGGRGDYADDSDLDVVISSLRPGAVCGSAWWARRMTEETEL